MSRLAYWHDALVNLSAHPAGYPLALLANRYAPTVQIPGFGLVVNDAMLAHEVLVRDDDFTKNGKGSLAATMTDMLGPHALGNMDGDGHKRLRGMLVDLVAPSQAEGLLAGGVEPLAEMTRTLRAGGTADLAQTMHWMSGRVTFDMLGITPPGDDSRAACIELVGLGTRIARGMDFRRPSSATMSQARRDVDQLVEYARFGFDSPLAPAGSFVRRLRERGLSFDEARGVIGLVFLAGTLTTAAALPRIVALLLDSNQFGMLRTNPAGIPLAVAEGLRFTTPVPATMRIAQRDCKVHGVDIAAGTRCIILTCNLARDKTLFANPNAFVATRQQPTRARNLWYGAGPHFCLGFAVAQRQLAMVLEALVSLPQAIRITGRQTTRGGIVAAYSRLNVTMGMNSA